MRTVILACSVLLAACTTKTVYIPVACIKAMPDAPQIRFQLDAAGRLEADVLALVTDHGNLRTSLEEHRALMLPCTKLN